uniref:Ig-like domain-containing protein n=1 Tax=Salvator merianae TaxID=96440 RepID=A0A8D0BDM0_SALMN
METKSGTNFVLKNLGPLILLTVSVAMSTRGESNQIIVAGAAVTLACPHQRSSLIVWQVYLKNGTSCYVSYMSEGNKTQKNCSKNVDWVSTPELDSTLLIKSSQMSNEGIYKCSTLNNNGTFDSEHVLTVLVPPEVSLTQDTNGTVVCKATAGKPAAKISWIPPGDSSTASEILPNGTETVTSIYNTTSAKENNLTCFISHPAWSKSYILNISQVDNEKIKISTILYITLSCLLGILLLSVFIYLWHFFYRRQKKVMENKGPETISRQNNQVN